MIFKVAYHTDVGIKKKTNQDSLAIKVVDTPKGQALFAIICDGMGGLSKGELASKEVILAYCRWFENSFVRMVAEDSFSMEELKDQWFTIAFHQNERIKTYGESQGIMIGTTLTAMLMYMDTYYMIHVGDSRIYEMTTDIRQLTKDQTFVAREVAAGRMTEEEAETDSRRSVLLQCIGASPVVQPDFIQGRIAKNATYMMCSDGFRHKISKDEMLGKLGPAISESEEIMQHNCQLLTELIKERRETDNITVLLVKTE